MCAATTFSMFATITVKGISVPSSLSWKIAWPCAGVSRAGTRRVHKLNRLEIGQIHAPDRIYEPYGFAH
jgi:hypothetical protein